MTRDLIWVEEQRFRGFACSECSWRFECAAAPAGRPFDETMRNFALQRDKEFASHVCAHQPGTSVRGTHFDWPGKEPISRERDKESTNAEWREVARQILREKDPQKMFELAEQLIVKFEEERQRQGLFILGSYNND